MKTIKFISICICLCFITCNSDSEQEIEQEIEQEQEIDCSDFDYDQYTRFVYGELYSERLAFMGMDRPSDSYNYPLYPKMDEYIVLESGARWAANQVPECILRKMSTQAVIQAIWEKPELYQFFIALDPFFQSNIETFIKNYSAFGELAKREDAGVALLERLTVVDPLTGLFGYESQMLELLLSRTDFLSQLNESEKRKIVEISLDHDETRFAAWWADLDDSIAQYTRPITWILVGKTMFSVGYAPFIEAVNENEALKCYIEGWMRPDPNGAIQKYAYIPPIYGYTPQIISEHAKNYINN